MSRFLVTCVVPTHLRADYLAEAIRAAASQTLQPCEILVVSDVDDEATERACTEAAAELMVPVRLIRNRSATGASASRNMGVTHAAGDLLAFLDDDDLWLPDYLERACAALDSSDASFTVCWIDEFNETKRAAGGRIRSGLREEDVIALNPGATGSNVLIRRHVFEAVGGFDQDLPVKNDTDLLVRLLRAGHTYAVVEEPLVLQRKHTSGQLTDFSERRALGTLRYIAKHRRHMSKRNYRLLRGSYYSLRSRSAPRRATRAGYVALMLLTYDPRDTARKIVAGRSGAMQRTVRS